MCNFSNSKQENTAGTQWEKVGSDNLGDPGERMGQIIKDFVGQRKEFVFYCKCKGDPLKVFK